MDDGCGKRFPSCDKAMKRVKVAFRASIMSWKGKSGACAVKAPNIGLKILVRMGEKYGRVMVWYSRTKREAKVR